MALMTEMLMLGILGSAI